MVCLNGNCPLSFFLGHRIPDKSAHSLFSAKVSNLHCLDPASFVSLFSTCLLGTFSNGQLEPWWTFVQCALLPACRFHFCHWTLFVFCISTVSVILGASHISLQTQSRHFLPFSSVFYSNFFPEAHFSSTAFRTGKRAPNWALIIRLTKDHRCLCTQDPALSAGTAGPTPKHPLPGLTVLRSQGDASSPLTPCPWGKTATASKGLMRA